ncbi:amidase domain-containing protein [Paenibacillus sonchi]|nr:amidase domain-containing protein [Paenibacillus sonchi]
MTLMKRSCLISAVIFLLVSFQFSSERAAADPNGSDHELKSELENIYAERAKILINGNTGRLEKRYLMEQALSKNAFRHERNRTEYMNTWADKRNIKLIHADSSIRIIRRTISGDTAKVSLVHSLKIAYVYNKKIIPEQFFGVGTRHFMTLKKSNGNWKIAREWYLDPLDENPRKIAEKPKGAAPSVKSKSDQDEDKNFNRTRAVAYANKYAGAAWGAGNQHHYNKKYLDYTGKGGDCTNFASQVIGDPEEGGGLQMKGGWRYFYKSGGTQTWVHTDSLSRFLLRSGYGKLIAKGNYQQIMCPSKKYPGGAVSELQPGDLVGYILRHDDTDHFSVIVGFDDSGYPLVNSHTADRYRVPFDLGWDEDTKYQLFHIKG